MPSKDSLINETPDIVLDTLVVTKPDGRDGHVVTPYAVEYQGNGTYNILVYDNNFPDIIRLARYLELR